MQHEGLKKLKALGLVEVLVALAIIGMTMVGAMQITTDAFRSIRDDEISDLASGFLLQGMEIAKSPQRVVLKDSFGTVTDPVGSYKIDVNQTPPALFKVSTATDSLIRTCNTNYEVQISREIVGATPQICLQVIIQQANPNGYAIKSHVIFPTRTGQIETTLFGYRSEDFL
jgi:type II secretory pathway pseudopilin PulG